MKKSAKNTFIKWLKGEEDLLLNTKNDEKPVYDPSATDKHIYEKEAKKVGLGKNIAMKRFDSMSGKFLKAINEANEQLMDKGFRTEQLKEKIWSYVKI